MPTLVSPTDFRRSARSRSADELDFYPSLNSTGPGVSVKDRIAQVQAHAKSNMSAKPKETKSKSSPGSISRRNSAPLLGSFGAKSKAKKPNPRVKPIDTSSTSISYHRPGVTPTSRLTSPAGQLSTFGTVYIPQWDNSRTESATNIPRPSTAPLPNDTPTSGDEREDEELLGGVHYSTYGGRTSRIYDDDTASPLHLYDGPFADACVPVPDELKDQVEKNELARAEREKEKGHKRVGSQVTAALLRKVGVESPAPEEDKEHQPRLRRRTLSSIMLPQLHSAAPTSIPAPHPASQSHVTLSTGTEGTHGTTSQEDTTLISMSKFPMPPADSVSPLESVPPTPASMSTVMPGTRSTTPGTPLTGARPTTPAVPEFLVASRSGTPGPNTEGESSGSETKPKLRTRASLLALAMRRDSNASSPKTADSPKTQITDSPKVEHGSVESSTPSSSKPEQTATPRPQPANTSKSDPRRRSMLERLAARLAGASAQDETWVDESFTSDLEDTEELRRGQVVSPVLDFDLPSEPLIDLEQFGMMIGSSSPVRAQASATFPPTGMTTSPPFPPTSPQIRTLSKLSTTGRKVLNKLEGRPSNRRSISVFSTGSRSSRRSRKKHGRGMSGESTRFREGGRLESITRRASADMLSAEGSIEGTVMYGVGEEMLRLMFGETDDPLVVPSHERERTRSLPRKVSTPKRPRGDLVARAHAVESENKAPGDVALLPDFGGSLDLKFSKPMANNPPSTNAAPRRKGHRRGTASASKENVSLRPKSPVQLKSRTRSKSAPLGLATSFDAKPAVGILTNGTGSGRNTPNLARGRVVIVNSATTPSFGAAMSASTPRRQTTRSNPMVPAAADDLTGPGVVVTAPTPPAPRRSMSMPLDGVVEAGKAAESETPRGTMSRGTSVQFVPESYEGKRSGKRRERPSSLVSSGPPVLEVLGNGNGNGNGKRKVEREPTDAADASVSSPFKKPKLSEEMDITFMGEPLFGGRPQHKRGLGSVDRASSHQSTHSRHSQTYSRHSQSYSRHSQSYRHPYPYPSPSTSPDPERASIPIHAIVTPRVQSLYGTGSEYASRRQSMSSIPRPKSRASARSNATGRRSNMTGARSARSNRTGGSKVGPRSWRDRLPMQGWCFLVGFLVPFVWWYAAFARAERGYYGGGVWSREVESQWEGVRTDVHKDDERIDAHTWRFRCRLMAAVSIVVYVPVIVLAAVFA